MHDLTPITALGGIEPQVDTVAGLTLPENPDLALDSVAARFGQEAGCAKALQDLLGAAAPGPGKALLSEPLAAVWSAPNQWMIGARFSEHEDLADTVKAAVGTAGSVTEQTDAWVCFDLIGSGIPQVMELCCNINTRALAAGDATRTSIHHLGCFVICGDPEGFLRLLGPRASAGSLHHTLHTAMKSAL